MPSERRIPVLNVVVLGDSGVGKTSLTHRYVNDTFIQTYKGTSGADFFVKDVNLGDKTVTLHVWDTDGRQKFHELGTAFFRLANCCVLVFDVNKPSTFLSIDDVWKPEFLKSIAPQDPNTFPFVLLGNKIEMCGPKISPLLATLWCNESNPTIPYFQTSAKDNINVEEAFQTIATVAYRAQFRPTSSSLSTHIRKYLSASNNLPLRITYK